MDIFTVTRILSLRGLFRICSQNYRRNNMPKHNLVQEKHLVRFIFRLIIFNFFRIFRIFQMHTIRWYHPNIADGLCSKVPLISPSAGAQKLQMHCRVFKKKKKNELSKSLSGSGHTLFFFFFFSALVNKIYLPITFFRIQI